MSVAKAVVRGLAGLAVLPLRLSLAVRGPLLGRDRAFQASCEWLSLVPGSFSTPIMTLTASSHRH